MITNTVAIFQKQVKDTFRNKTILIQFVMFPVLTVVMENAVKIEGMPVNFFVNLFATMYVGMAPLTSMAAVISEEKEKNTLRVLRMANVKFMEYLLGVGGYIWLICMLGACVFGICGQYKGRAWWNFVTVMAIGILVSILIGAVIGTWGKNQMAATSITVPVMMIFSFLPMLSMFNSTMEKIARFTYSQQLHLLISNVERMEVSIENISVMVLTVIVTMMLFIYAYKKQRLK